MSKCIIVSNKLRFVLINHNSSYLFEEMLFFYSSSIKWFSQGMFCWFFVSFQKWYNTNIGFRCLWEWELVQAEWYNVYFVPVMVKIVYQWNYLHRIFIWLKLYIVGFLCGATKNEIFVKSDLYQNEFLVQIDVDFEDISYVAGIKFSNRS